MFIFSVGGIVFSYSNYSDSGQSNVNYGDIHKTEKLKKLEKLWSYKIFRYHEKLGPPFQIESPQTVS